MINYCNFEIIASPICDVDISFLPLEIISLVLKPSSKTSWTAFSKAFASLSKLREYFKDVIDWIENNFKNKKIMKGVEWGSYYNEFKSKKFNTI